MDKIIASKTHEGSKLDLDL